MEGINGVYDLGNGITTEQMVAMFFDEKALRLAPRPVYRMGGTIDRIYYTLDESLEPRFYSSVTGFIESSLPTSPHLIKWIAEKGYEESQNYTKDRSYYGTFLHIEIGTLLIMKKLDLDKLRERLLAYIESNKLPQDFVNYEEEFKKDLLAFAQWCIDYSVKPLSVEIVLASEEMGVAGAIDLVAELTIVEKGYFGEVYKSGPRKGEPKESKTETVVTAIIDFKSGRKGFFEAHEIQLESYRLLWNENFPEIGIDRIYNCSPKDWRGENPTYNFTDQSGSKSLLKLPHLLKLGALELRKREKSVLICEGEIDLEKKDVSGNFVNVNLSTLIKMRKEAENGQL